MKSRLFAVLAPYWWNKLNVDVRTDDTHLLPQPKNTFLPTAPWIKKITKNVLALTVALSCDSLFEANSFLHLILAVRSSYLHG